jgi:hypothetical protein
MSRKRRRFTPFSQEQFDMVGKVINIQDGFSHIFAVHEESNVESEEKDNEEGECVAENYTGPDATQNSATLHALSASLSSNSNMMSRKKESLSCEQNRQSTCSRTQIQI